MTARHKLNTKQLRTGFTLIEMVMVISVSGVLLVINTLWIHQSLKYSSAVNGRLRQTQSLYRLADAFRKDVWTSDSVSLSGENEMILMAADGVEIRYLVATNNLSVEKLRSGAVFYHDQYRLVPGSVIRWDVSELPNWITLVVERGHTHLPEASDSHPFSDTQDRPVDLHLRTALGRWGRDGS